MKALSAIPSPVLHGTVQVDDTFLRDSQKGSRELYNPLPESFNTPRIPRNKKHRSVKTECGPQGNEYSAITCAMGMPRESASARTPMPLSTPQGMTSTLKVEDWVRSMPGMSRSAARTRSSGTLSHTKNL